MALRKRIAYSPKQERIEAVQGYKEKAACLTFIATQAVWWMALYYHLDGMREFSKEDVQAFQLDYMKNYKECCPNNEGVTNYEPTERCIETLNSFSDRTGFEFTEFTKEIHPRAKLNMVTDKYPADGSNEFIYQLLPATKSGFGYATADILKGADEGIREGFQVAVQTLKQDFLFADQTVLDCIDKVIFVMNQYGKGKKKERMNLEFMVKYLFDEFDIDIANFGTVDKDEV